MENDIKELGKEMKKFKDDIQNKIEGMQKSIEEKIEKAVDNKITDTIQKASLVFEERIHKMMKDLLGVKDDPKPTTTPKRNRQQIAIATPEDPEEKSKKGRIENKENMIIEQQD